MRNPTADEWTRILRAVKAYCSSELDSEDIAQSIWIESLEADHVPTRYEIRLRCIDAIRRFHREQNKLRAYATIDRRQDEPNGVPRILDHLVVDAGLTLEEKEVLVKRFYQGQNLGSIASDRRCSIHTVNVTLWNAIDKLRAAKRRAGL